MKTKKTSNKKGKILDCAGLWSDLTDEQIKEMENAIKKSREYTRKHINLIDQIQ